MSNTTAGGRNSNALITKIVFTGGICENQWRVLEMVCRDLSGFGIILDPAKNEACRSEEMCISTDSSKVQVWVIPTNEEIIVARQTVAAITKKTNNE